MAKKIEELLKEAKIGSLKLPVPVVCSKDITLEEAIEIMQRGQIGYVVVVENKKVLGIFTEKDVTLNILERGVDLKDPVSKHMNSSIQMLTPKDSIGQAIDLMHTYEYRHIVLVNDERELVSVLSVRAIIRFLAEHYPAEVLNLPPRHGQIMIARDGG